MVDAGRANPVTTALVDVTHHMAAHVVCTSGAIPQSSVRKKMLEAHGGRRQGGRVTGGTKT